MRLSRAALDALLPSGPLWVPEDGGGLDNLLDGMASCLDLVRVDLKQLARVRAPLSTLLLSDLEREYGVIPRAGSAESVRRTRLEAAKVLGSGDGSLSYLQSVLDVAGFNLRVHENSPPVDPGFFVYFAPSAICGNDAAICGASSMGAVRGELLVNGDVYYNQARVTYAVPTDPGYWPLFFFVGGAATRNGAGELTDIEDAAVPVQRKGELASLILRCKPMDSWAALRIQYT